MWQATVTFITVKKKKPQHNNVNGKNLSTGKASVCFEYINKGGCGGKCTAADKEKKKKKANEGQWLFTYADEKK